MKVEKIFISWSKEKSKDCAIATKKLLENLNPKVHAFLSETDIMAGENVQEAIIEEINKCDILILCFTEDNKKSPWLLFEAGYAKGKQKIVVPLLFDEDMQWHSWIDNPMNIVREIKFESTSFKKDICELIEVNSLKETQDEFFQIYFREIKTIKDKHRLIDIECVDIINKLSSDKKFLINSPYYDEKKAIFLSGFESFEMYKAIIDCFLTSGKYLWFFGRKNMKLFSGNFDYFFNFLKNNSSKKGINGIDFRCLFLDPNSDEVLLAHKNQEIFKSELKNTIIRATDVVGKDNNLKKCLRLYSCKRDEIIIRVDNCIIYSKPYFDSFGRPELITNSGFEVFSVKSKKGKECIKKFKEIWDNSKKF